MRGYVVSQPVVLRSATQVKHIAACEDFHKVGADRIQINSLNEYQMVRDALAQQFPDASPDTLVKTIPHERLAMWSLFPMLLGRRGNGVSSEGDILRGQLLALRAKHPKRQRFRILINNGFGTNLGDTLIGLTAFRAARSMLRETLPEVSVDVLTGWIPLGGVSHLLRQQDGVEQVLTQGPTLQAMAGYQGLFDFSDLIKLANYGKMAPVDWYLWWLGLDPAQVGPEDKRNRIDINPADTDVVTSALSGFAGPKTLINPKASEALRRMPATVLQTLAHAVLAADPAAWVVFDQAVSFDHPRAIQLAELINSPQRLAALVAQVDGVITPDTFVQHVADATGTPACTLSASVPSDFFRYYPTVKTLALPGAETLGGWGKTKVSAEEWETMEPAYQRAWAQLDAPSVLAALNQARQERDAMPVGNRARIDRPKAAFHPTLTRQAENVPSQRVPSGQRPDLASEAIGRVLLKLGWQILLSGDTVALLGAGAGDLALQLADRIAPNGRLVAFEPRRMIHQVLCANVIRAGHEHIETHPVMPIGSDFVIAQTPGLSLREDHAATAASNLMTADPVVCWPLDRLDIGRCRLIIIQAPVPVISALEAAVKTVRKHRPFVVAGPIRSQEVPGCTRILGEDKYTVKAVRLHAVDETLADLEDDGTLILVAQPRRKASSGEES